MDGGGGGAYGSSGASGEGFDFVVFIKKPQVILRIISWVFSIIVFGCIASQAWNNGSCAYNEPGNCNYGTAVGVLAFLGLMAFLILDAVFDSFSNVLHRKYIVIADICFSGLWSCLWFICFCLLTDKWRTASELHKKNFQSSGVEAAIAFSFFSIGTFVALTVLAALRYRQGIPDDFTADPSAYGGSAPYSGAEQQSNAPYQTSGGEYTQSPFSDPKPLPGGYQQQTY